MRVDSVENVPVAGDYIEPTRVNCRKATANPNNLPLLIDISFNLTYRDF